jgi:hypothetical protein
MQEKLKLDLETYKKSLVEKSSYLQQLKQAITRTDAEINMLNGAIQACEKLLEDKEDASGKTDGK